MRRDGKEKLFDLNLVAGLTVGLAVIPCMAINFDISGRPAHLTGYITQGAAFGLHDDYDTEKRPPDGPHEPFCGRRLQYIRPIEILRGWHAYGRFGQHDKAIADFNKAIELNQKALTLNKDLFCATAMLAQIYLVQGQYERAIEIGRRSIELGPNIAVNYVILGVILRYAGHFEEAITLGEKAVRLHPFCPWYYLFCLARSYRMAGRYEEALGLYRQILNRAQKEAFSPLAAYIGLADVYSEMGRVEEAHTQASEILRINPNFSLEKWSKTEPFGDAAHLGKRLTSLPKACLKLETPAKSYIILSCAFLSVIVDLRNNIT
jgi:tetratricopeptide (TPR) repeat protein